MSWILVFIYSLVVDAAAVVWTASVEKRDELRWRLAGTGTTMLIATMNWLSVLLVVDRDHDLMVGSIMGHAVGYLVGGRLADLVESRRGRPTTAPGSQSSDPS
jgi:hypothetical protein